MEPALAREARVATDFRVVARLPGARRNLPCGDSTIVSPTTISEKPLNL